jgi:hypothetical protein
MSEEHDSSERGDSGEERGFKVEDKRRFSPDGDARDDVPDTSAARDEGAEPAPTADGPLPEIDFSTFILSLSTSAMVHLGEAPRPDGTTSTDLQLAKQTIDILALLKAKTAGNLADEEDKLLGDLLYDLRLRFVSAAKR